MTSAAVGREDLERQLEVVRSLAPGEMEGVFGPDSLTWRIDREALTFLAPAAPSCSNWLTRGSRRPSPNTRRPLTTRLVAFIAPSAWSSRWCSARSIRPCPRPEPDAARRYPRPPADHRRTFPRRLSVSSQRSCSAALDLCHLG